MTKPSITAIIIARNEAQMIANCIECLRWCDEILVVDNGSNDTTADIAEKLGARLVSFKSNDFDKVRNEGLKRVKTDWVAYIDADERVTPNLAKEIMVHLETDDADVLQIRRENMCYGHIFQAGGWEADLVTRVFKRKALQHWQGEIHESPVYTGRVFRLHHYLLHLTHRSTTDGLRKTIDWTPIEAELLAKAGIPPVTLVTILRKGILEFFRRAIIKRGYKDGMPGLIEAVIQGINRALVYIQVWELQQKPNLSELYKRQEVKIANLWHDSQ